MRTSIKRTFQEKIRNGAANSSRMKRVYNQRTRVKITPNFAAIEEKKRHEKSSLQVEFI